jgi:hypothetical protein
MRAFETGDMPYSALSFETHLLENGYDIRAVRNF